MAVRATVNEGIQFGLEVTPGTGVSADKRILGLDSLTLNPIEPINVFKPAGSEAAAEVSRQKVNTEWQAQGPACYLTLPYLLNMLLNSDTSSPFAFDPSTYGLDTIKTFTIETGSATRAEKIAYAVCHSLRLRATKEEVSITASGFGRKLQQNITKTSTPTNVGPVPFDPDKFEVKMGTTLGGVAMVGFLECEFNISNRWAPHFVLDDATDSFTDIKKLRPTLSLSLTLEYVADAETLLTALRDKTTMYFELGCLSAEEYSAGNAYNSQLQLACKVIGASRADQDGVFGGTFQLEPIHDANLGAAGSWLDWVITNGGSVS